ncbi:MAG: DUF5615 family PIN-like protein [Thermomonas sp.]|uniref:DUF5615 family PIN-like protein n=1 Tax=Thermomonas sp. TaxID=1971895 RepID=UPI0039E70903
MKLLIDMNLSPRWVEFLASEGIAAVHWSQVGDPKAPDETIMRHAAQAGFIVFTNDLDFSAILAATHGGKPSVAQLRADDVRPATVGRYVVQALKLLVAELEAGALISIEPERTRVRLLPL